MRSMMIMRFLVPENAEIKPEHIESGESGNEIFNGKKNSVMLQAATRISSLLKNPAKGGIPAMARQAIRKVNG